MAVYVLIMHNLNIPINFLVSDHFQHLLISLDNVNLFSHHFSKVNLNHSQLSFKCLWDLSLFNRFMQPEICCIITCSKEDHIDSVNSLSLKTLGISIQESKKDLTYRIDSCPSSSCDDWQKFLLVLLE